jgi:hypothetical protein
MTLKEWDEAIERMTKEEAQKQLDALKTLESWPEFNSAFRGTCMFSLEYALRARIERDAS